MCACVCRCGVERVGVGGVGVGCKRVPTVGGRLLIPRATQRRAQAPVPRARRQRARTWVACEWLLPPTTTASSSSRNFTPAVVGGVCVCVFVCMYVCVWLGCVPVNGEPGLGLGSDGSLKKVSQRASGRPRGPATAAPRAKEHSRHGILCAAHPASPQVGFQWNLTSVSLPSAFTSTKVCTPNPSMWR